MSKGTQHHAIRIPDDLWAAARARAVERGDHLSEVIRDALRAYVADPTETKQEPDPM